MAGHFCMEWGKFWMESVLSSSCSTLWECWWLEFIRRWIEEWQGYSFRRNVSLDTLERLGSKLFDRARLEKREKKGESTRMRWNIYWVFLSFSWPFSARAKGSAATSAKRPSVKVFLLLGEIRAGEGGARRREMLRLLGISCHEKRGPDVNPHGDALMLERERGKRNFLDYIAPWEMRRVLSHPQHPTFFFLLFSSIASSARYTRSRERHLISLSLTGRYSLPLSRSYCSFPSLHILWTRK